MKNKKSILYALSAVVLWSTVATAFKLSLRGMSPYQLLFFASLTSVVVLSPIAYKTDKKSFFEQFKGKNIFHNLLFGFLNPFLYYTVLFKAYDLLPAQEAQPLNYTWPIVISIFSVLFLKEKFSLKTFSGLIISFAGIVVIATRGNFAHLHFHNLLGTLLALFSAVIWGAFWILKIKDERKDAIKLFASFFYGTIFSFLFLLAINQLKIPETEFLLGAVYVGLFEMGITFFLWMKGLSYSADRTKTSTLAYFSPFISLLFIALILGEKIRLSSIIGLLLIVGGILIQNLKSGKNYS